MPISEPPHQGRLLLCNIGRIGDTIIRNTLIGAAASRYGQIDYICGKGNREIVAADPRINRVHVYGNSLKGLWGTLRIAFLNSSECYIDLKDHDSSISLLIATLARAKLKVGCNRKKFRAFHRDTSPAYSLGKRKLDVIRDIAMIAGLDAGKLRLIAPCNEESEVWFSTQHPGDQPFYFVNISATDPTRMWSNDNWVRALSECGLNDRPVLISGVPEHADRVKEIAERIERGRPFKPRSLMDVIAAIKRCALLFSVDTGLIQVAAAFEKPVVALYSSTNIISEFAPIGNNNVILAAADNLSLASLDPRNVINVVKESGILRRF